MPPIRVVPAPIAEESPPDSRFVTAPRGPHSWSKVRGAEPSSLVTWIPPDHRFVQIALVEAEPRGVQRGRSLRPRTGSPV